MKLSEIKLTEKALCAVQQHLRTPILCQGQTTIPLRFCNQNTLLIARELMDYVVLLGYSKRKQIHT